MDTIRVIIFISILLVFASCSSRPEMVRSDDMICIIIAGDKNTGELYPIVVEPRFPCSLLLPKRGIQPEIDEDL